MQLVTGVSEAVRLSPPRVSDNVATLNLRSAPHTPSCTPTLHTPNYGTDKSINRRTLSRSASRLASCMYIMCPDG